MRLAFLSVVLALGLLAADPLLPVVSVTVTSTNWAQMASVVTLVSNRVDHGKLHEVVAQVDGVVMTNGGSYSATWFLTMAAGETNAAWRVLRFVATNALPAGLSATATYHVCPCGPGTNPPAWGSCRTWTAASFSAVERGGEGK